jgi:ech hydrogenase subunit B
MPGIFIGFCYILLIKFRKSPFDISMSQEAHQELIGGVKTELSGRTLAVLEVAHWYENVFLLGMVFLFFLNNASWSIAAGLAACVLVFFCGILIDNSASRVKWERMLASTWMVTLLAGFLNVAYLIYFK